MQVSQPTVDELQAYLDWPENQARARPWRSERVKSTSRIGKIGSQGKRALPLKRS